MPISFSDIPSNLKIPLYWVEIDPSMAGIPVIYKPALVVGTMLSAGTAQPNVPIACGTQAEADANWGQGSELARMFMAFFNNNFSYLVYGIGIPEPESGTQATGTITVTSAPTEAGTIALYVSGEYVQNLNVGYSDTEAYVAAAIADCINGQTDLPVTAAVDSANPNQVNLTCTFAGVNGNDINLMLNYYGTIGGEVLPTGLVLDLGTGFLSGGAGIPDFLPAISGLGENQYDFVALPYTDSQSLMEWETEYGFTDVGRWGWMRQLYGQLWSAKRGTYPDLITWGDTQNSGVLSVMGIEPTAPTPIYEWTAAYCAMAQRAFTNDPARPLQTLPLTGVMTAPKAERFNMDELQGLAENGIATQKCSSDGVTPMIMRETTTYQLNVYGFPDDAYELATTLSTLTQLIRNQREAITSKFPRMKLADDGTKFGPGQAIVTPGIIKAELIAEYQSDEFNGLVQDDTNFAQYLMVERDPNDPNRVNVLYPPFLINQLRVFAVLAQFRLQVDAGLDTLVSATPINITGIAAPAA